jgi:alpha-tubulin suppressor-like RCC1 family protein
MSANSLKFSINKYCQSESKSKKENFSDSLQCYATVSISLILSFIKILNSMSLLLFVLSTTSLIATIYAGGSFDPHIHPPSEKSRRRLSEGFHSDIDDLSVSAGFQHTCGITTSPTSTDAFGGQLMCWGFNQKGQAKPPAGTYIQVSCGMFHSCALNVDEKIKCWGAQGIGSSPDGEFLQVSCGNFHTCAILKDGHLKCWGKNYEDQVTDAPTTGDFVQVSSGKTHNCAIRSDGTLACWGSNTRGESQHPEGYQFIQVSASPWHHTCGVTVDHDVLCWGADGFGQSSDVPEGMQFSMVSTGRKYTCGILANGTTACWGQKIANYGFDQVPANHTWTQLSSGYMHNCGVTSSGDGICWGQDTGSQSDVPKDFLPAA